MADSTGLQFVSAYAFEAMQKVDVVRLAALSDPELRLLLPCLLSCLLTFHALEQDARKEQQLRHKAGGSNGESILVSQLQHGLTLEFEHSDPLRRLRLTLSELLAIMNKVADSNGEFFLKSSELFESPVYLEEVADVLCILQAELPSLLPIVDVAEALLHVRNGDWFLCLLVANVPDSFNEVCRGLIKNGERQDEESVGGRRRTEALRQLCLMNPSQALNIRAMVVEECHLPGLGVALTLDYKPDTADEAVSPLVSYVSGLLLGTNSKVRTWFSMFIRNGQQRKRESSSVLWQMRRQLLLELVAILPRSRSTHVPNDGDMEEEGSSGYSGLREEHVVKASALLRLYCALMGIAGLSRGGRQRYSITTQLLILYYILSYEENLLASTKQLALMQRKPKSYSAALMDQIPIKYLVTQAQGLQQELGGLHSALLRLLATNYPHLCLVEDWVCEEEVTGTLPLLRRMMLPSNTCRYTQSQLHQAFQKLPSSSPRLMRILEHLTLLSPGDLIPYAEALTASMALLLEPAVPLRILQTLNKLWMGLNTVMPRRLWVMTVNALQPSAKLLRQQRYTQNDLMVDPLIVLRCDQRVYRCPPLMDIVLHMLNGYLLASKAYLHCHLKETADFDRQSQTVSSLGVPGQPDTPEVTREELKNALLAAQDSAAVQILLEVCLPTSEEQQLGANTESLLRSIRGPMPGKLKQGNLGPRASGGMEDAEPEGGLLSDLREVQCLICCLLHQMFIADPNIAKLVHFQGYPQALLPLTVAGIPSIHICLDFIPELLAQPQLEKQIFAIQLLS
ncbi:integrator complex subunit 2 isoform X1, partial [Lates japonicus]